MKGDNGLLLIGRGIKLKKEERSSERKPVRIMVIRPRSQRGNTGDLNAGRLLEPGKNINIGL